MTTHSLKIASYVDQIHMALSLCEPDLLTAVDLIRQRHRAGRTLWVLGNGGSLAIAQHFAQDLVKLGGVRAQALNCPSIISAYTNDEGFDNAYVMPLNVLRNPGDLVMIFSCSGKSPNYGKFLTQEDKPDLISVVGTLGGFLKTNSKVCIHVKSNDYQVAETGFNIIADLIVKSFINRSPVK